MSKQPLVNPIRRPLARQRATSSAIRWAVATLASAGAIWAESAASTSSSGETVAVPALLTATPEASWAKAMASSMPASAASARPMAASVVSAAPEASNTSRAAVGKMAHRALAADSQGDALGRPGHQDRLGFPELQRADQGGLNLGIGFGGQVGRVTQLGSVGLDHVHLAPYRAKERAFGIHHQPAAALGWWPRGRRRSPRL